MINFAMSLLLSSSLSWFCSTGKTLIAAVAMYNFYRWFPTGKVVFLAPTRPLVTQQIEACYNIMGIPMADTAEISGRTKPSRRSDLWKTRRVFFCTPQSFQKDLEEDRCDPKQVVCLVLDEAHRASGKYAYVQAIDILEKAGAKFRVVCLIHLFCSIFSTFIFLITDENLVSITILYITRLD